MLCFKNSVPNSSSYRIQYRISQPPKFSTKFLKIQNSVPNSSNSKIQYQILQKSKIRYWILQLSKFGTEFFKFLNSVPNSLNFKIRYRILQFQNSVPNSSNFKIRYLILQIPKFGTKFFDTEFLRIQKPGTCICRFKIWKNCAKFLKSEFRREIKHFENFKVSAI